MQTDVLIALTGIFVIATIAFAWIWFTTPPKRDKNGE